MTALEQELEFDLKDIVRKCKTIKYNPSRFAQMLSEYGALETCHRLIAKQDNSWVEGFYKLQMEGKMEWSMEFVVLNEKYKNLFSEEEREICRKRLKDLGFQFA